MSSQDIACVSGAHVLIRIFPEQEPSIHKPLRGSVGQHSHSPHVSRIFPLSKDADRPSPNVRRDQGINARVAVHWFCRPVNRSGILRRQRSAITALSFERPVVAPAIGCLPELIDEKMGVLYDPSCPGALRNAMFAVRQYDEAGTRAALRRKLQDLEWDTIARRTLEVYSRGTSNV